MDPLACVSLPVLSGLDVLAQRLVDVVGADVQLTQLSNKRAETSGRSYVSSGDRGFARAGAGGPAPMGLPCLLVGAGALPRRTTSLMLM